MLLRNLNTKVHLSNLRQRLIPSAHLLQMRCVVALQLSEQIGTASLHGQEEEVQEIEEWETGIYTEIRGLAGNFLHSEICVGLA